MRIKKKLQKLFDKAQNLYELQSDELASIKVESIYIVDTKKPYIVDGQKNGYNTMAILIYDEIADKYYSIFSQSHTDVILFFNCNLKFANMDVPSDLGCLRIRGFNRELEIKSVIDSLVLGGKEK